MSTEEELHAAVVDPATERHLRRSGSFSAGRPSSTTTSRSLDPPCSTRAGRPPGRARESLRQRSADRPHADRWGGGWRWRQNDGTMTIRGGTIASNLCAAPRPATPTRVACAGLKRALRVCAAGRQWRRRAQQRAHDDHWRHHHQQLGAICAPPSTAAPRASRCAGLTRRAGVRRAACGNNEGNVEYSPGVSYGVIPKALVHNPFAADRRRRGPMAL